MDITGVNTTVTLQPHEGTIPNLPEIGKSLSTIQIDVPVPRLSLPGSPGEDDGDGDGGADGQNPHFIQDATVRPEKPFLQPSRKSH